MKYMCNDMSHRKITHLPLIPTTVQQHLSILLEDDYPLSQVAYTNLFSMLLPGSTVVLSHSPQETYDFCSSRTYDLLIIDLKVPNLSTAANELLHALTTKTSVVIISAARRHELTIPTVLARVWVFEKPLRIESLISLLKPRFDSSGD